MDWQEGLDAYLAWTRQQEALEEAQRLATWQRAVALAAMRDGGKSVRRIAWLTRLSPARVGQLLALVDNGAQAPTEAPAQGG